MNTDTAPLTKLITLTLPDREGSLSYLVGVDCLAISPDGRHLAGASDDVNNKGEVFPIFLWSLPDGKLLRSLAGHVRPEFGRDGKRTAGLVFTPDSRSLISWGCDFTARVWDVETGRCRQVLEYTTWVRAVAVDPGGELFAVWHESLPNRISLYTLPDGKELQRDMLIEGYGECLAATPDGQHWVGVTDKQVCIWRRDGQSHKAIPYNVHAFSRPHMAFSPDGATLYVAIADDAPTWKSGGMVGHHVRTFPGVYPTAKRSVPSARSAMGPMTLR